MNDLEKSQLKRASEVALKYKEVLEAIQTYENYRNVLKAELIELFESVGRDKVNGVRLVEKSITKDSTIGEVKKLFNDSESEVIDYIVVNVDIDKTIENIYYFQNLQGVLAKKVGEKLSDLQKVAFKDLKVGK
jgi:uncharacterized protein YeeX (DUF496 family)